MFRSQINPPRSLQSFSASHLATSHSSLATAPLTPFPATLRGKSQLIENPAALSPVVATLTRHVHHNPFVCHSYKKHPGVGAAIVNFFVAQTSVCALSRQSASQRSQAKDPHELKNLAVLPVTGLPRPCRNHRSPVTASVLSLPPVTSHQSPATKSFTIRTYEKPTHNPFRIRTSKTQHLKPFRMNTYKKTPRGVPLLDSYPMRIAFPLALSAVEGSDHRERAISLVSSSRITGHGSRVTAHHSRVTNH